MTTITPKPRMNRYLQAYLLALATRPLLTKSCTSGCLSFTQELLASVLAGQRTKVSSSGIAPYDWLRANEKAFKLAAYGFFVSAPLAHTLMGILQRAFASRQSARAKLVQIIVSNLTVTPITATTYLACLAIINGAKDRAAVIRFIQLALFPILKVTWITGPISMAFAQKFLPAETWVPFFSLVAFCIGLNANTKAKRQQLAAAAKAKAKRDAQNSK